MYVRSKLLLLFLLIEKKNDNNDNLQQEILFSLIANKIIVYILIDLLPFQSLELYFCTIIINILISADFNYFF